MQITSWYTHNFEARLQGRYITLNDILPILETLPDLFEVSVVGSSELNKEIPLVTFGHGTKKVLIWSQMHGNESTTTKAIFDFFKLISSNEDISEVLLKTYAFTVIPILNPDGAALYTRENARKVDLNRDAQDLSQKESKILKTIFDLVEPDMCLNMHDQRTIYGLPGGFPATVSFLAPSADTARTITPARKEAMKCIVKMHAYISQFCPKQIGRYDDGFNLNCVGDTFTSLGVPTILFEAGHFHEDYDRDKTRVFIFYALIALFDLDKIPPSTITYFDIPENQKNYNDLVLRNVAIPGEKELQDLYFQYKEVLVDDTITFDLYLDSIEANSKNHGHQTFDLQSGEILLNSQRIFEIGQKITTIFDERQKLMLI